MYFFLDSMSLRLDSFRNGKKNFFINKTFFIDLYSNLIGLKAIKKIPKLTWY